MKASGFLASVVKRLTFRKRMLPSAHASTGRLTKLPTTPARRRATANMDKETARLLRTLLDYMEDDEREDYESQDRPANHIYLTVRQLRQRVESTN